MRQPASSSTEFLANALSNILFRLSRKPGLDLVIATTTIAELKARNDRQELNVTPRKLQGKRVVVRAPRHENNFRLMQAKWPADRMDECTLPSLLYVLRGEAHIYIGDYTLHCAPGRLIYIPAGVPKADRLYQLPGAAEAEDSEVFWFYPGLLWREGIECWVSYYEGNHPVRPEQQSAALVKNQCIAALFNQLCEDIEKESSPEIISQLFQIFFVLLKRDIEEKHAVFPRAQQQRSNNRLDNDPIDYAQKYINSHLNENLTIEKMARLSVLSTTNFKLLFKKSTGMTFKQYLRTRRVELATRHLQESNHSVQKIAESIGLTYAQLYNLIQDYHQCSPGAYRKKQGR